MTPEEYIAMVEEENKNMNEKVRFLEECLDNKEKVNKSLREDLKNLKEERDNWEKTAKKFTKCIDTLESSIKNLEEENKSLKNINALSGGEMTLTAIALLFSILNIRVVPFCILDEVEAALDEVNVKAFGEYLLKLKEKTQFIVITHKKKTMEYANVLYGITMQESGISKLVSVKLEDIKEKK